jgi:hypothetical protein
LSGGDAELVEEGGEVVVDGFPFEVVAARWVHGFREVLLMGLETFFDEWYDVGRCRIVGGNENAAFVAPRFEAR